MPVIEHVLSKRCRCLSIQFDSNEFLMYCVLNVHVESYIRSYFKCSVFMVTFLIRLFISMLASNVHDHSVYVLKYIIYPYSRIHLLFCTLICSNPFVCVAV